MRGDEGEKVRNEEDGKKEEPRLREVGSDMLPESETDSI